MKFVFCLFTIAFAICAGLAAGASEASAAPSSTFSYYVSNLNSQAAYDAGCRQGSDDLNRPGTQTRVVILAFGSPAKNSSGVYGVNLTFSNSFASRDQIRPVAVQFAAGYYSCTSSDTASTIILSLGVTNFGSGVRTDAANHGKAWSNFVGQVNSGISGYSSQVSVRGAFDAEVAFNSSAVTLAQVDGFASLNSFQYYDYGDTGGCPTSGRANCVTGGQSWTIDERYQIMWGRPRAFPFPENYNTARTQARQLANLSNYGYNQYGSRIAFAGVLAQFTACQQNAASDPCTGTDNTPAQAWQYLVDALNASSLPVQVQPQYSDDIADLTP